MGGFWLRDLADWCRAERITVREWPNWQTRARSTGGFDQVWGIVAHHTGSKTTWTNDCNYQWQNAPDKPIGNVHLDRAGVVTVGAAGATNTNGAGLAPWVTSQGVIPTSPSTMGNRMAFAIEAANNGVGERWPRVQVDVYLRLMSMLCRRLGLDPMRDVNTHQGWAGPRKIDPYGPADGYPSLGNGTWPVAALRALVRDVTNSQPQPEPEPQPPPPGPAGGMMHMADLFIAAKRRANGSWWVGDGLNRIHTGGKAARLRAAAGLVDCATERVVNDWDHVGDVDDATLDRFVGAWDGASTEA